MKVYELMERLSEMPAGAVVTVSTVLSSEDLEGHDVLEQTDAGENLYSLTGKVDDVDEAHKGRIYLYVNMEVGA